MSTNNTLDKIHTLIDKHIDLIRIGSETMTKDGLRGFTENDSKALERYAKLMILMNKKDDSDEFASLSDEELQAIANGEPDAAETSDPD